MSIQYFSTTGYVHLCRSLLRFCEIGVGDALELVYNLNMANLDSFSKAHPDFPVTPSLWVRFHERLTGPERPYRTEVQLYKSLEMLRKNIDFSVLFDSQREAVRRMECLMSDMAFRFYTAFGIEIDSPLTVFKHCADHLIPKQDEPSVCILEEWINLPSA